jgi:hypothetical protein
VSMRVTLRRKIRYNELGSEVRGTARVHMLKSIDTAQGADLDASPDTLQPWCRYGYHFSYMAKRWYSRTLDSEGA